MDPLVEARDELLRKSREQIEQETAYKWAARSVAAYQLAQKVLRYGVQPASVRLLRDAAHYYEEALEHAAMSDNSGAAVREVRDWVYRYVPPGAI